MMPVICSLSYFIRAKLQCFSYFTHFFSGLENGFTAQKFILEVRNFSFYDIFYAQRFGHFVPKSSQSMEFQF